MGRHSKPMSRWDWLYHYEHTCEPATTPEAGGSDA